MEKLYKLYHIHDTPVGKETSEAKSFLVWYQCNNSYIVPNLKLNRYDFLVFNAIPTSKLIDDVSRGINNRGNHIYNI